MQHGNVLIIRDRTRSRRAGFDPDDQLAERCADHPGFNGAAAGRIRPG
jgi:hypothetical protein